MSANDNNNDRSKRGSKKACNRTLIDHTYYDYSTRDLSELLPDHDTCEKQTRRVTFPMKLHAILSGPDYRHIIRWMPHGRCWKILDSDLLANVVCTQHFNHSSYDSFNRSVNGWGFKVCHFSLHAQCMRYHSLYQALMPFNLFFYITFTFQS